MLPQVADGSRGACHQGFQGREFALVTFRLTIDGGLLSNLRKGLGGDLPAQIAIDACAVDVKIAAHIFRSAQCYQCHESKNTTSWKGDPWPPALGFLVSSCPGGIGFSASTDKDA